ncbi:hypothetical protein BHS04_02385 [Myxococcus xanthus]|nr:hypothetical protein BHS04_02385 [Myxococcus xanthus]
MKARPIDNPPNPWASTEVEYLDEIPPSKLEVLEDHSRQVLSHNDSPDVGFDWSVNPYRGCLHACAYCYARPTHQYLSRAVATLSSIASNSATLRSRRQTAAISGPSSRCAGGERGA